MAGGACMAMQPGAGAKLGYPVRDDVVGQALHSRHAMQQACNAAGMQSTGTDMTEMHA